MHFPPLQPITNAEPFVSGDVKIDPSVAIASGVILQAASNCQIIIAAGACIGMGAILHAYQGNIEVESGVTIGAGVLVVGKSKIGANACIGSVATIIEHDIEPRQILLPASIIGEAGRKISLESTTLQPETDVTTNISTTNSDDDLSVNQELTNNSEVTEETETQETQTQETQIQETEAENNSSSSLVNQELTNTSLSQEPNETQNETDEVTNQSEEEVSEATKTQIYGQDYVNQMMKTLFPHKNSLSYPPDEED